MLFQQPVLPYDTFFKITHLPGDSGLVKTRMFPGIGRLAEVLSDSDSAMGYAIQQTGTR